MEDDSQGTQSAVSPSSLPCEMEVLPHLEEEQENISESASLDEQTQPDTSSEQTASPAEKKPLCGDKSSNDAGNLSSTVGNGSLDEIVDLARTVCDKSLDDFGFTKGKLSRCDSLEDVKCCDVKLNGDIPNVNKGLEYVELAIKDWSPPPKNQIYQQSSLQPSPKASKYLTESSVKSSESPANHLLSNGPSHSNHPLAKPYNPENFQKHPPGMSPYTPPSCATTPTTPVLVKTRKGTQMTFDDMLKQLEEKIKLLIHTEDFSVRGTCRSALKFIQQQTRYSPDVVLTEHVVDKIVQHGMAHVFLRVWRSVLAIAPQENLLQLPIESFAYKNLDVTLSIIWNCSDKSVPLCNCLSRCGVIGLLMVELSKSELTVLSIPENTLKVSDTQTSLLYLVKAYLGILHNIVRLCVDSCTLFRAADAVVILRAYLAAKQGLVYAKAYLILAYLIDEQENELVNASDEHVQFMVDVLKDATCSENHFSETHGFNAAEIACGLNHLAVNDSNKTKIVKAGALQYYARLLQGDSLQEQVLAAAGLWILAFDDDNKRKIHDQSGCITDLTYLADTSPQEEIRRSARGALWVLNSVPIGQPAGITRQMSVTGDNADIPHVMLSYNHSTQPMMIKICAKLRERGYKVWMDVDHMFGSTLEAMALAVEQSAVVLVAMCQRYKDSASCRTEAEYTYQLRKDIIPLLLEHDYKADGWLGVLIGTRLYNDFSTEEAMNNSIDRLVRELGKRGRLRETVSRQSTRERTISGQLSVGALSSSSASSSSRRSHANSESEPGLPSISSISTSASSSLHGSIVRVTPPTPVTPSTPLTPPSIAPPLSEVVRWSNEHVASWLFANKLAPVMDKFSEFDGDLLLEYRQMFRTSPDFFYQSLERHLGLSIIYILRFTKALKGIG